MSSVKNKIQISLYEVDFEIFILTISKRKLFEKKYLNTPQTKDWMYISVLRVS